MALIDLMRSLVYTLCKETQGEAQDGSRVGVGGRERTEFVKRGCVRRIK